MTKLIYLTFMILFINYYACFATTADDPQPKFEVTSDALDQFDSAFDEIEYINRAYETERLHPLAKHIVQGDIMTKDGDQAVSADKRMTIKDDLRIWRTRQVPYVIASQLESASSRIKLAMDEISQATCLKFTPRKKEENFLHFRKLRGCYSSMGMQGGGQEISIGTHCDRKEIIQHLILHTLGMYHENSRQDRDDYIKIIWENITANAECNFRVGKSGLLSTLGLKYDTTSLMHFGNNAFGNGKITMESLTNPNEALGNKNGLSQKDIEQLNILYKCSSIPETGYGPVKMWADCEYSVKRLYRICYGGECDQPNNNGIQHIRMKCDETKQAAMQGCFVHKPSSPNFLQLQEYASKEACTQLHNSQPINFISSLAFLDCMKNANKQGYKVFGISEFCKCHYGETDNNFNIAANGESAECGDAGHGASKDAIFMYKILKYEEKKDK